MSKYDGHDAAFARVREIGEAWAPLDDPLAFAPPPSLLGDLQARLAEAGFALLSWAGRNVTGPLRLGGFLFLFREREVRAALADRARFRVPFGPEMEALAGPPVFGLGDDGPEHALQRRLMQAVVGARPPERLAADAAEVARALLDDAPRGLDAVDDLLIPVLAEVCRRWYGLRPEDPHAFADWSAAISALIFGTPWGADEVATRRGFEGARRLQGSIARRLAAPQDVPPDSVLGALTALRADPALAAHVTDARIASMLVGMISGTMPTTLLGAAKALERILARRARVRAAARAARTGDVAAMERIVRECLRLRPPTWPGVFRRVSLEGGADDRFAGLRLRHGEGVLVCVASALRDAAAWPAPHAFRPERMQDRAPDLAFGSGAHDCLGRAQAVQVTTAVFMELFAREGLRRAGRLRWRGVFPAHLPVRFAPPAGAGGPCPLVAVVPLEIAARTDATLAALVAEAATREGAAAGRPPHPARLARLRRAFRPEAERRAAEAVAAATRAALDALDANPAAGALRRALDATERVHDASVTLAALTRRGRPAPALILEFNVDGPAGSAIAALEGAIGATLEPVLAAAGRGGRGLGRLLRDFDAAPRQRPFGDIGVAFDGIGEWTVRRIAAEKALADAARAALQSALAKARATPDAAPRALEAVREALRPAFGAMFFRPRSARPAFAAHPSRSFAEALRAWATSRSVTLTLTALAAALAGVCLALVRALGIAPAWAAALVGLAAFVGLALALAALAAGVAALLWARLRRAEATDPVDPRRARVAAFEDAVAPEDAPGSLQNHITAVNRLKPGALRRLALALGVGIIALQVRHWFRPGFVVDIGTIRHARWLRPRGTDQLVFQATFDGSWERYLEDFSNQTHQGQSMVWSNCEGFPETRGLTEGGAYDADRFKRWVRTRQVRTGLWYSRFAHMTNDEIRRNALIREGLARAATRSRAETWLRLFGSSVAEEAPALAPEEIQALTFRSFGHLPHSACLLLRLEDAGRFRAGLDALLANAGRRGALGLAFGLVRSTDAACCLGFTAQGLEKLGLPPEPGGSGRLAGFPMAFVRGMGAAARALGDEGAATDWTDRDAPAGATPADDPAGVDAVAFLYAQEPARLSIAVDEFARLLAGGARIARRIDTALPPAAETARRPGLGFADGLGQPRIAGDPRDGGDPAFRPGDAVAAGEFILGLPDEKGLVAPSPVVPAAWDRFDDLPDAGPRRAEPWPDFSAPPAPARDFGRNGVHVALRQIALDRRAFEADLRAAVLAACREGGMSPTEITDDWLAEKIVGRRRDGRPIAPPGGAEPTPGAPGAPGPAAGPVTLRRADPQGDAMPLGSHVRRAHPRDSLDAAVAPSGSNRHRMLRRGRPYGPRAPGDEGERGLLFLALVANLERQFEFVTQSWLNWPAFHGLVGEVDPLLGRGPRRFTIPTRRGPLVVTLQRDYAALRGGAYLLLPGRAALRALARPRGPAGPAETN